MQPIKDLACYDQMAIIEKYERVIMYLYPIAQSVPRKHGVARDMFLHCLMGVPDVLSKFLASWSGHAKWADTNHLFTWLENKHDITI